MSVNCERVVGHLLLVLASAGPGEYLQSPLQHVLLLVPVDAHAIVHGSQLGQSIGHSNMADPQHLLADFEGLGDQRLRVL